MSRTAIHTMAQRTPEWYQVRAGKLTGSAADALYATIKSGEAAARRDLRVKLAAETITGRSQETDYVNDAMQRGIDLEPAARRAFEASTGLLVTETGFIELLGVAAGCSLDGHLDDFAGIVSFKCPKTTTHIGYMESGDVIPNAYVPQMLHECWITGARNYFFCSYDDRLPPELATFIVNTWVTDEAVAAYESKALAFLQDVENTIAHINQLRTRKAG